MNSKTQLIGKLKPFNITDSVNGIHLEIKVSEHYTIISIDGREYYFNSDTGEFDGTGQECDPPIDAKTAHELLSKAKEIILEPCKGEIDEFTGFTHYHAGVFSNMHCKATSFVVTGNVLQEETQSILRVEKTFDNYKNAKEYLEDFVSKNPLSEMLLYKNSKTELINYI